MGSAHRVPPGRSPDIGRTLPQGRRRRQARRTPRTRCPGPSAVVRLLSLEYQCLKASFTFSPAFFASDFAWSARPSFSWRRLPVTLPMASLVLPSTSCMAFLTLSVPLTVAPLMGGSARFCTGVAHGRYPICDGRKHPLSGQPGALDDDGQLGFGRPRHDALDGRHVRVIAAAADDHMPLPNLSVVGRIVPRPLAEPPLDPRMTFADHRFAEFRILGRVQVARHVPGRDADLAQCADEKVRVVLAHSAPGPPRLG